MRQNVALVKEGMQELGMEHYCETVITTGKNKEDGNEAKEDDRERITEIC